MDDGGTTPASLLERSAQNSLNGDPSLCASTTSVDDDASVGGLRVGKVLLATAEEWQTMKHVLQAAIAIYGNIIFWIGGWNLGLYCCGEGYFFNNRDVVYALIGLAGCVATDTLYYGAGVYDSWFPARFVGNMPVEVARTLVGLACTLLLWLGCFMLVSNFLGPNSENLYYFVNAAWDNDDFAPAADGHAPRGYHDFHRMCMLGFGYNAATGYSEPPKTCPQDWEFALKDSLVLVGGWALLWWVGALYNVAGVLPIDSDFHEPRVPLTNKDGLAAHAKRHGIALTSIFAQCAIWVGAWDLLEYYNPKSLWREVSYLLIGLAVWFSTKTFFTNSFIDEAEQYEPNDPRPWSVLLFVRVLVASFGNLIHIVGAWTLFDEYAFVYPSDGADVILRNWAYVGVGVVMMGIGGTLKANACVSPVSMMPRRPLEELLHGESWQSAMLHMGFSVPNKPAAVLRQQRMGMLSEMPMTERVRNAYTFQREEDLEGGGGHGGHGGRGHGRGAGSDYEGMSGGVHRRTSLLPASGSQPQAVVRRPQTAGPTML